MQIFMKTSVLIFFLCFLIFSIAESQSLGKTYSLKEVCWTIELPKYFTVLDSAIAEKEKEKGVKIIEEINDTTVLEKTRTLISANKGEYEGFDCTIAPQTDTTNSKANLEQVKKILYNSLSTLIKNSVIDSSSSETTIDGLSFHKFRATTLIENKPVFTTVYLFRFYNNYEFSITYTYMNEGTKDEIEVMLNTSKFKKICI